MYTIYISMSVDLKEGKSVCFVDVHRFLCLIQIDNSINGASLYILFQT